MRGCWTFHGFCLTERPLVVLFFKIDNLEQTSVVIGTEKAFCLCILGRCVLSFTCATD